MLAWNGFQKETLDETACRSEATGTGPRFINATLPMFCAAVDADEARKPFMPTLRGCFGHSWDTWPVSLAKYAAGMREGERQFLAAEALLAVTKKPPVAPSRH